MALEEEVRTFIQNELEFGRQKETRYDPQSLAVLAVVDTGKAFEVDQRQYPVSLLLSYDSKYRQGLVTTLRDDLLSLLIAVANGKCVCPQRSAREVLDAVENIPVERFLRGGRPVDLKQREARLRARLNKLGLKLQKSRVRNPRADRYGSYQVIDAKTGAIDLLIPTSLGKLEQWNP